MIKFLRLSHRDHKHNYAFYKCLECGKEYIKRIRTDQKNISCGCVPSQLKHGHERNRKKTAELSCWQKIKERCYNINDKSYAIYGGRGITVDDRWRESFEIFLRDMGSRPSNEHSIERKDVNGPYSKDNCVWATKYEQARNTRRNVHITLDGEHKIIGDWLHHFHIPRTTFYRTLKRKGLDYEQTLRLLSDQYD